MAMRSNFLCRLEVYRGPNECTLRSFSIEEAPSTILEMVNLLKSYDLRLQHGTFELTAAHGQDEAPRKLLSDDDVVAFFSVHSCPCFVFTAVIDHCDSGVGSSMLVDDPLVLLSIQHSDGGVPTTKRFIPPRREIWKALLVAVRGAIQQVLLPGQQLTLFSTEGNGKALTEICSEEAAALLIRSCMAQRSVCHLTYNIGRGDAGAKVVGATLAEVDKKEDKDKVPISTKNGNDQLPTCAVVNARSKNMDQNLPPEPAKAETVKPVAVPEPAKAETVKPVAVPEPAKAETVKPVAVPEPAKAETVKPVAVPEPAKAETVKPVAVPEPAKAETVKPVAVPEPAKAEIVEKPNLSLAVSVFLKDRDANAFAMKKSPVLRDSEIGSGRLLEPLFTKDVLVGEGNAASRPWNNAKVLPTGFKGGDGDAVTAKNGKGADESPLTSKNATECISGKKNCSNVEEELPNEVVVEVACSLEKKAPVRFFLTWKKASPKVFESFRNECLNALHLTDMDNIIIYDSNGVPLCNPSGVTAMVGEAIRKKRSCINVTAVRGHPCTSGLPLQCLFTWGTQQVMRALVLRPGCALEDMRSALAEECGLKEKDMGELSFRLVERGELDDMELTPDNVYKELKRVAENSCVVRIAILDRRRTSLIAFLVRTLCDAASAFAAEVEHVFGGHFTEMDVVPILTRCCDLSPLEGDVKRYVDAVISNLEGSQVLRSDNVVKAVLDPVSICGEEVALSFLNRCIAVTELMSSHRPFEVLMRFFRRLYRSIEYPERTESGVPLNVVTRQLAYAGLSDARWLLFRDQPFSSVVHEKDFVEMLQRVYAGNPNLVCRVAVACRLSGISSLKSRRVMAKEERDVRRQHCRKEIAHAFDGIRPDEVIAYIHHYRLHGKPNHCCLLGTVSTLLANCSERLSSQWFVERVTQRCSVTMETMLQNFEDAQIPLPLLYQLCWDVLRPELHHLTLLPESHVASAFAYWAMFAVQLLCINRNLEFPPVPLVDLKEFTWVVPEKASADTVTDEADGAVAIALPTPQPAGVAKKKIKYKYSYLCHDLRRDQRFLPMIR